MSLILEALRKSEAERRRAQAPDLFAEPQLALPRVRPAWPRWRWFALGAVALIVSVLLVRAMWLPATPAAAARMAMPEPAPAAPDVAITPAPSSTPRAAAVPAAEALPAARPPAAGPAPVPVPSMPPGRAAAVVLAPSRPPARPRPEPVTAAPVGVAVPVPAADSPADAGTQRLADLGMEERQQLPPLKLSMHMWDDAPAQRFVILDGQRLGEGDRIGDAVVEQITRDGAILAWNGRRLRVGLR